MIYRYFTILIALTLLSGCAYNFRREKLVTDCFPPFEAKSENYISYNDRYLTLWTLSGEGRGDAYLKSKNIVGHIVSGGVAGPYKTIGKGETLYFTGEVVKHYPSWDEYHIGGSRENALRVVVHDNKRYLSIFQEELNQKWYESLPGKCRY